MKVKPDRISELTPSKPMKLMEKWDSFRESVESVYRDPQDFVDLRSAFFVNLRHAFFAGALSYRGLLATRCDPQTFDALEEELRLYYEDLRRRVYGRVKCRKPPKQRGVR